MSKDDKSPEEYTGNVYKNCDFSQNETGVQLEVGEHKFINSKTNDNLIDGIVLGEDAKVSFDGHESKRNGRLGITTIANAIKKPRANNNKGLKIIVGFVLTCIITPLIVGVSLELWKEHRATSNQEQPRSTQTKEVPGSDQI